jgi:hypothetical protein
MKLRYLFVIVAVVVGYNAFLIQRDRKMFEAYDRACAQLPQGHSNCRFSPYHK